jgi:hypothetical protein
MTFTSRCALACGLLLPALSCAGSSGSTQNQGGAFSSGGRLNGTAGGRNGNDAGSKNDGGRNDAAGASNGGAEAAGASSGGAANESGGAPTSGASSSGGASASGATGEGGAGAAAGSAGAMANCSGPVGTLAGALAAGINFIDTDGQRVNAHGGGIIQVGDTFYLHGEYFSPSTTDNNFNGFSMYSSKDLATWKSEGIVLPQQASGELGPNRKGERPHIIKCPSTGEFVLFAHAASEDYQTDKEVIYATSPTVNGKYAYKGPLKNASGALAVHSDMTAISDGNAAFVITESAHVYTLAADCHSFVSDKSYPAANGDSGGLEAPTMFKAGSTYYWIGSYKTGWRANNNFYSTAPAVTGPWTFQGYIAPVTDPDNNISDQRTWLSQTTWVLPVTGCKGTTYVYWGDHWDGTASTAAPGKHNNLATFVFQPLVFEGIKISMPT